MKLARRKRIATYTERGLQLSQADIKKLLEDSEHLEKCRAEIQTFSSQIDELNRTIGWKSDQIKVLQGHVDKLTTIVGQINELSQSH